MDLTGTYVFNAPVDTVWKLMMDTTVIGGCLPGGRGLKPLGNDRYEVELAVALAAVAGSFKGTVALEEKVPPQSYKLVVEGSGRQGFVKGHAQVTLAADGNQTQVQIAAHAEAGGMIARVGQRLLEAGARTLMERFFACMAKQAVEPPKPDTGDDH